MIRKFIELTQDSEKSLITLIDSALKQGGYSMYIPAAQLHASIRSEEVPVASGNASQEPMQITRKYKKRKPSGKIEAFPQ